MRQPYRSLAPLSTMRFSNQAPELLVAVTDLLRARPGLATAIRHRSLHPLRLQRLRRFPARFQERHLGMIPV